MADTGGDSAKDARLVERRRRRRRNKAGQYVLEYELLPVDTVTQSVTGDTATQSANDYGFRLVTTNDYARAGESWKTPRLGKLCNRLVTSSDGGSLDWRQRGEQPLEGEEETSAAVSSRPTVGRLKYNGGPNEVSGAGEWDDYRHGEVRSAERSSGRFGRRCEQAEAAQLEICYEGHGATWTTSPSTDDESGEYVECSLATHGADDEPSEYAEGSLATHRADDLVIWTSDRTEFRGEFEAEGGSDCPSRLSKNRCPPRRCVPVWQHDLLYLLFVPSSPHLATARAPNEVFLADAELGHSDVRLGRLSYCNAAPPTVNRTLDAISIGHTTKPGVQG
ncbi:hypothetical protein PR003_g25360 [Phytophthora rubi]|uniref:Uncharacterized protein n=1 Tax=Phytophthora rubi TaxID=129364 RepID=A0A6A4CGW1_9STRA|nr:hypothetical protein PR003_g25360 [Phytophthora rubi]